MNRIDSYNTHPHTNIRWSRAGIWWIIVSECPLELQSSRKSVSNLITDECRFDVTKCSTVRICRLGCSCGTQPEEFDGSKRKCDAFCCRKSNWFGHGKCKSGRIGIVGHSVGDHISCYAANSETNVRDQVGREMYRLTLVGQLFLLEMFPSWQLQFHICYLQ